MDGYQERLRPEGQTDTDSQVKQARGAAGNQIMNKEQQMRVFFSDLANTRTRAAGGVAAG